MIALRLAAIGLVVALAGFPLTVLPVPFLAWLAVPGLLLGVTAVILRSVSLVTASAVVALVEYALALVIAESPVDVLAAAFFGAALLLLLELVHLASRVHGATVAPAVIAARIASWLAVAVLGAGVAIVLTAAAAAVRGALPGGALPVVVLAAALGALVAGGGVMVLVAERGGPGDR